MHVYTHKNDLSTLLVRSACLVNDAVLRAGDGCFTLAIQYNRTVQIQPLCQILLLVPVAYTNSGTRNCE
jgi:hypothetical protein